MNKLYNTIVAGSLLIGSVAYACGAGGGGGGGGSGGGSGGSSGAGSGGADGDGWREDVSFGKREVERDVLGEWIEWAANLSPFGSSVQGDYETGEHS